MQAITPNDDQLPDVDMASPEMLRDPFVVFGRLRERSPLVRVSVPGIGSVPAATRHHEARQVLTDPRFKMDSDSVQLPGIPDEYRPYLRTMAELDDAEHTRLRRLARPVFTPRRAEALRPRVERITRELLDTLPDRGVGTAVDLCNHLTRALPVAVMCELIGIPETERPQWRERLRALSSPGDGFAEAVCGILDSVRAAVAHRRDQPGDDLVSDLMAVRGKDGDRLTDNELIGMMWQLVTGGQESPTNVLGNAIAALLTHPDQLAALRADPALMSGAVDELLRWCNPVLLTIPRRARVDVELGGVPLRAGKVVSAAIASANRDPRVFDKPDELDIHRTGEKGGHLGFGHGRHFCLGAALARTELAVALGEILHRFPGIALAVAPHELEHSTTPGVWRLASLPVTLQPAT